MSSFAKCVVCLVGITVTESICVDYLNNRLRKVYRSNGKKVTKKKRG